MSDSETERKSRAGTITATVVVVVLLYILSPAPVVAIFNRIYHGGSAPDSVTNVVEVVYAPLILLYDKWKPVKSFYNAYFKLCGVED